MSLFRKYVSSVLLTVLLLLAVRGLLVTHMRLPSDAALPGFIPRQHVFVNRLSYGLRLPGTQLWGYHRWGNSMPQVGDCILFNLPRSAGYIFAGVPTVGVCRALPGDTVWLDPMRKLVLPARTSPDAQPLVIPGPSGSVTVTPANVHLLAHVMQRYEQFHVAVQGNSQLMLNGKPQQKVKLSRNYYWIEMRPDAYALVPHELLIGKIMPIARKKG